MSEKANESTNTQGIRVFVYGTLKQGHGNHPALEDCEFLGRSYIEGNYRMVDLGFFPGVVECADGGDTGRIFGEVYKVDEDTLYTLDLIEGHPDFYERRKVPTQFKNAWVYLLPDSYLERYEPIEDGIWEATDDEKEWMRGIG